MVITKIHYHVTGVFRDKFDKVRTYSLLVHGPQIKRANYSSFIECLIQRLKKQWPELEPKDIVVQDWKSLEE